RRRDLEPSLLEEVAHPQHHPEIDVLFGKHGPIRERVRRANLGTAVAGVQRYRRVTPEAIGQIRAREIARPSQRLRLSRLELADEFAGLGLVGQVRWQILAGQKRLDE